MQIKSFEDLMSGHQSAEILNLLNGEVVRRLVVKGPDVEVDAMVPEKVTVPLATEIVYEPWVLDRGNLLFSCPEYPRAKICTEWDIVRYPDGTEQRIEP